MTDDEDEDNHGAASGESHSLDHIPALRETDQKPRSSCDEKYPPLFPSNAMDAGRSTCNPEVCHLSQNGAGRFLSLIDCFLLIGADMDLQEPVTNSTSPPVGTKSPLVAENVQGSAEPNFTESVFQTPEKSTLHTCNFLEEDDDIPASPQQRFTASKDSSQNRPDNSSLASEQSYAAAEPGVLKSSLNETDLQPFDDVDMTCGPPYCQLCPFRPVTTPDGYPSSNSPMKGCKSKSSPKLTTISEQAKEARPSVSREINRALPSCVDTAGCEQSKPLGKETLACRNPPSHANVDRLCCRIRDLRVSSFEANCLPVTGLNHDVSSGTHTTLLTFAVKHFISPQEVKIFNIEYYRKRVPTLFSYFVEFCGQGANGLCFLIGSETPNTCKTCFTLNNALNPLDILIRNTRCLAYNEHGPEVTSLDAILSVVSAGTGLVRLKPISQTTWEEWTHFPKENTDEGNCFIKRFTQAVQRSKEVNLLSAIRQCITCVNWPTEIENEFKARKRESKWLDQNTLEDVTKTGCCAVPFVQDIDWLLIFPEAECRLSELLTNEQRQCFFVFQVVLQHQLLTKPQAEESVGAMLQLLMCLDHVLFHACDAIQDHMWKMSPGYCFLVLFRILDKFLRDRHLPHYIVRNRNLLTTLSANDFLTLEAASRETLRNPLQVFQILAESHKFTNAWVLHELLFTNRLIGGHRANIVRERVLLPLALRLSKEFMRLEYPEKAYECIEDILNAIAPSNTDGNNPYTTDVSGFFEKIARSEKDSSFLCRLAVYLKLSKSIDISNSLPGSFTNFQDAIGPAHELSREISDLPFPEFTKDNVSEKVFLLEELAFQLTHHPQFSESVATLLKGTCDIAGQAVNNLKAKSMREEDICLVEGNRVFAINGSTQYSSLSLDVSEEEPRTEDVRSRPETRTRDTANCRGVTGGATSTVSNTDCSLETNSYKVMRTLKECQFRCLWNLFRCYEEHNCTERFEAHLDELERLCEQLGEPKLYIALGKILRRLGHLSRAQEVDNMAQIMEQVRFGV